MSNSSSRRPAASQDLYIDRLFLKELSALVCTRLEDLFDALEIDLHRTGNRFQGCCPIHGGNNNQGFHIYEDGHTLSGNWQCYTHKCDEHFPRWSAVGFIRGVLSHQECGWEQGGDRRVSHRHAVEYALKFMGMKPGDVKFDREADENARFAREASYYALQAAGVDRILCTRDEFRRYMKEIPAPYYLERGYSRSILDEYDVGFCDDPQSKLRGRVVVPVYDVDMTGVIGCLGRHRYDQCRDCRFCHPPSSPCPNSDSGANPKWRRYAKWVSSDDFVGAHHVYNLWRAHLHIKASRCVVLVEGVGDVWRLEEAGIHNAVAIMGTQLHQLQYERLHEYPGCMVVITDNDDAGESGGASIVKQYQVLRDMYRVRLPQGVKDVGEMSVDDVRRHLLPAIMSKCKTKRAD